MWFQERPRGRALSQLPTCFLAYEMAAAASCVIDLHLKTKAEITLLTRIFIIREKGLS